MQAYRKDTFWRHCVDCQSVATTKIVRKDSRELMLHGEFRQEPAMEPGCCRSLARNEGC